MRGSRCESLSADNGRAGGVNLLTTQELHVSVLLYSDSATSCEICADLSLLFMKLWVSLFFFKLTSNPSQHKQCVQFMCHTEMRGNHI